MKRKFILFLTLIVLLCFTSGCFFNSYNQASFDYLMNEYFHIHLTDPLSINFTLKNPADYGIQPLKPEPYVFSPSNYDELAHYLNNFQRRLNNIDYEYLNKESQITYDVVWADVEFMIMKTKYPYYTSQLGVYFGYHIQLPIILSEYHFYSIEDIENYFGYLASTKSTFAGLIEFEQYRIQRGFGYSSSAYVEMAEQCREFTETDDIFLISVFNKKINECPFLDDAKKNALADEHLVHIGEFIEGYRYLELALRGLIAPEVTLGGLCALPDGAEFYEAVLKDAAGCDRSVDDVFNYLLAKFLEESGCLSTYVQKNPDKMHDIIEGGFTEFMDYEEVYAFLKNNASADFPTESIEADVRFEYIHPALQEHVAPAFYILSPIDDDVTEVIYLGNRLFDDPTNAYFTIGHEGLPGHLLQHNILKKSDVAPVRKMLSCVGYAEGWAIYVENYIGRYLDTDAEFMRAYNACKNADYLVMCLADIEIHYYGLTFDEFVGWIGTFYVDVNSEACRKLYNQIAENPAYYPQYYLSYYLVTDLYDHYKMQAKANNVPDDDIDYDFHEFYLQFGPAPFYIMETRLTDYTKNKYKGNLN